MYYGLKFRQCPDWDCEKQSWMCMNTASTQLLGAQQTPDAFESQSWNWHLAPEPKIPSILLPCYPGP